MGNPWVFFTLSLPIPVRTRTHEAWVRICTGLPSGTDTGMVPMGKGMDIHGFAFGYGYGYGFF